MKTVSSSFFQFAGVHSFLIGLLPFFIPVLLLKQGVSIEGIALFIALTGFGFIVSLKIWEALFNQSQWRWIVALSFISEVFLVGVLLFSDSPISWAIAALFNGVYNCFYWTTQRMLFSTMTSDSNKRNNQTSPTNDTGKQFGNFQILVVVVLKLGILVGAFMLEDNLKHSLWLVSSIISLAGLIWFFQPSRMSTFFTISQVLPVKIGTTESKKTSLFRFKDSHNSSVVFYLDGVFLFLESYFWVVSLFLISQENVKELGVIIVTLTVLLSVIFYVLKNKIDSLDRNKVYTFAVIFYALSWWLRSLLDPSLPNHMIYPAILLIAFLTTFFRLSFNKRFFDHAREQRPLNYLLAKSYLSQTGIVIFYSVAALLASYFSDIQSSLATLYLVLTPIALIYMVYTAPKESSISTSAVANASLRTSKT
ncbi:hypothetical protein [Neptunomonas sp.]|uniref:hypothetical protein n=1 Tax=Neptunomonas sp. TaxID=1971898 RepID=UPI0025EA7342|nr:hypothetical protein [Neptunomonas sp.]